MVESRLPNPGTEYGHCVEQCVHIDCNAGRIMARCKCQFCGEPVGYETGFFKREGQESPYIIDHAICVEKDFFGPHGPACSV